MRNGDGDGDRTVIGKADDRMVEHHDPHIGTMERAILPCPLDGRQRQVGKAADQTAPRGDHLVKYPVAEACIKHLQRGRRHVHLNIAALVDADGLGNDAGRGQKCSIRHQLCRRIRRPEAVVKIEADRAEQGQQHPAEQLYPQTVAEPRDRRAHLFDETTGHV